MKKVFIILTMGILFPISLFAQLHQAHDWEVNASAYSNNMSLVIQVHQNGVLNPNLEIGAFCGQECRGKAESQFESHYNTYLWALTVHGDANDDISFYVRENGVELLDVETLYHLVLDPSVSLGSLGHPVIINFITLVAHDYKLITDPSQLVAGRSYFIANSDDGDIMAMGRQGNGKRLSATVSIAGGKTNFIPAFNALDEQGVFVFTLGGNESAWTLFDVVNDGYLETRGDRFDLEVDNAVSAQSQWQITVNADGTSSLWNANAQFYMAYYGTQGFYCSDDLSHLYLFAECELVSGEQASISITEEKSMYVVPSGSTLTVETLNTIHVSNLIVEDGAQLVNATPNVSATLQKNLTAYSDQEVADGWYTIAAPLVATASVASCSNLTAFDYDLYEFDETNLTHEEWRNYKVDGNFENFTPGRGYLYANNHDVTLNMFGPLNATNVTVALTYTDARTDELNGFNLIGNPYPHAIYKGRGAAISDNRLSDGYYLLSNAGAWQVKTYSDPILPGQGILVMTSEAGDFTIAKTTALATAESSASRGISTDQRRIALRVSDGATEDIAYLYATMEGRNLRKISHLNNDVPELSFCLDKERFAIAHLDDSVAAVDVRFDNHKAATYTMTWDLSEWQGGRPCLIDHFTGAEIDLLKQSSYIFEANGHEHPFRFQLVLDKALEGTVTVFPDFQGEGLFQVIDLTGRVVSSQQGGNVIDTRGLAPGVYVVRLIEGDRERTEKILVR